MRYSDYIIIILDLLLAEVHEMCTAVYPNLGGSRWLPRAAGLVVLLYVLRYRDRLPPTGLSTDLFAEYWTSNSFWYRTRMTVGWYLLDVPVTGEL